MKIFITGASGFVGGAAASHFLQLGHQVMAMSRSVASDQKIEQLGATPVRCALGQVTLAAITHCDAVIHAAAYVEEWGTYDEFYQANVVGTEQMLTVARQAGVKRFIHIGTEAALFAGQDMVDVDETYPYPDTDLYYPKTKQLAEKAVLAAHQPGVFATISVRPRMIWGPGDQTILPVLKEKIAAGQFLWIDGGRYRTSSTHIANLVHGIALALEHGRGGQAYFITDGETATFRDFVTRLLATQGVTIKAGSIPKWLVRPLAGVAESLWRTFNLKGQPPITRFPAYVLSAPCVLSDAKARRELGYQPVISVAQGLQALAA